jgi:hypothetical protein
MLPILERLDKAIEQAKEKLEESESLITLAKGEFIDHEMPMHVEEARDILTEALKEWN